MLTLYKRCIETLSFSQSCSTDLRVLNQAIKTGTTSLVFSKNCAPCRHPQNTPRLQVFATLQRLGLFDVLTDILIHGDEYSQLKAADVIMSSLQNDSSVLREYMVQQDAKMERNMLSELVRLFLVGSDGIQATYLEILIFLMDPDSMEGTAPDKDKLLDIFYDKHMRTVVSRVTSGKHNIPEDESGNDEGVPPWSLTKIVDLLIFLVQNHQFRIKYYMLRNHVLQSSFNRWTQGKVCRGVCGDSCARVST